VAAEKWHPNARAIWDHGIAKPGAEVVTDGHGHTVFRVRGKTFLYVGGPQEPGVGVKLSPAARTLLTRDPDGDQRYDSLLYGYPLKINKYSGQHGWVDVWARDAKSLPFVLSLIDESYQQMAPKRMRDTAGQAEAGAGTTKKTARAGVREGRGKGKEKRGRG
jgi:predicted DNA-binding protein (MmcQ/YjbR family)